MAIFDRLALQVVEEIGPAMPKLAQEALEGICSTRIGNSVLDKTVNLNLLTEENSLVQLSPAHQTMLIDKAGQLFASGQANGEALYREMVYRTPLTATASQLSELEKTNSSTQLANLLQGIQKVDEISRPNILSGVTRESAEYMLRIVPEQNWSNVVKEISAEEKTLIQTKAGSLWLYNHPNGEKQFFNAMTSPPTHATESLLKTLEQTESPQQIDSLLADISKIRAPIEVRPGDAIVAEDASMDSSSGGQSMSRIFTSPEEIYREKRLHAISERKTKELLAGYPLKYVNRITD